MRTCEDGCNGCDDCTDYADEEPHPDYQCRNDGRCQYAIDSGAEELGHCPRGKCVMPEGAHEVEPSCKTPAGCAESGCLGWCDEYRPDPALKPDIAALKKRLAEDSGFAAQVTGDRPPTPVGWSDTDWLKHLEEIRQDQETYRRGPLPETGWD